MKKLLVLIAVLVLVAAPVFAGGGVDVSYTMAATSYAGVASIVDISHGSAFTIVGAWNRSIAEGTYSDSHDPFVSTHAFSLGGTFARVHHGEAIGSQFGEAFATISLTK